MRQPHKRYRKRTDTEGFVKIHRRDTGLYFGLFKLYICKCGGESGPPHGNMTLPAIPAVKRWQAGQLGIQVCNAADVIIVAVGEYQPADILFFIRKIADVGEDEIYPVHFFIRKPDAAVNDENVADFSVITIFIHKHVFGHVAGATQGDNADTIFSCLAGRQAGS